MYFLSLYGPAFTQGLSAASWCLTGTRKVGGSSPGVATLRSVQQLDPLAHISPGA